MERVRLTDQSVADIKVATTAKIEPTKGGFNVVVANEYGSACLKNGGGAAVYKTKGEAKRAVGRHNENVVFETPEVLPSPSMRPPEV